MLSPDSSTMRITSSICREPPENAGACQAAQHRPKPGAPHTHTEHST